MNNKNNLNSLKVCLITNMKGTLTPEYLKFIDLACKGGVTSVQLRKKNVKPDDLLKESLQILEVLKPHKGTLIINDNVEVAAELNARTKYDTIKQYEPWRYVGVHIGPKDMNPSEARKILGPKPIIGYTIENMQQLEKANKSLNGTVSYVTATAIFDSKTKPGCNLFGLDGLREFLKNTLIPTTVIGGVNKTTLRQIMDLVCSMDDIDQKKFLGAAVVGAIHDAENPEQAARELINVLDKHLILC